MRSALKLFFIGLSLCSSSLALEPVTSGIAFVTAIGGSMLLAQYETLKCKIIECCDGSWIKFNSTGLKDSLDKKLYGQHLVINTVMSALKGHWTSKSPSKALVLSFHGWTGSGKNYVSRILADNLFALGMKSEYVHTFISTLHFPHRKDVDIYQDQLREWVKTNVTKCGRSLFIFDEVDKLHPGIIDGIKPYMDHYTNINGVDYRRAVFIFLSNSGALEINKRVIAAIKSGKKREDIQFRDLETALSVSVYNEKGGLSNSEIISKNLVNVFVPFLPLEKRHVIQCIEDFLTANHPGKEKDQAFISKVADQLQYFPEDLKIFSTSGCKRIPEKVNFLLEASED